MNVKQGVAALSVLCGYIKVKKVKVAFVTVLSVSSSQFYL